MAGRGISGSGRGRGVLLLWATSMATAACADGGLASSLTPDIGGTRDMTVSSDGPPVGGENAGGAGGSTGGPGAKPGLNAITQPTMHSSATSAQEPQPWSWKPGGKKGSAPGRTTGWSVSGFSQRAGQSPHIENAKPPMV